MNPHIVIGILATSLITIGLAVTKPTQEHIQYEQACMEDAKQQFMYTYQTLELYKANQERCEMVAERLYPNN